MRTYKQYVISIAVFLIVDSLWGLCSHIGDSHLLFYDAMAYNFTMSLTIMMCCLYVAHFLELANFAGKLLKVAGILFFAVDVILLVVNCFSPVLFYLDADGAYHTGTGRDMGMCTLILMFIIMTLMSALSIQNSEEKLQGKITLMSIFSFFMTVTLLIQSVFPLFPCYAVGLLIGIIILFSFLHVSDQKQRLRDMMTLEKSLAKSTEANEAKVRFFQNMSHEIRTPLNSLFGFAQLLGMPDGTWTPEEKESYNKIIFSSYNMLEMLMSDILDSIDAQNGNYRMKMEEFSPNEACRSVMMLVEARRPSDVTMRFSTDLKDSHLVMSDSRRVQQILINFMTNACKNTVQGEILLRVTDQEKTGKLIFSVTDTGRGVPLDKADIIFGRYTKLDKSIKGSGLGLNICDTIAGKLNGKVYLDTSYQGGARFKLEIDDKKD